MRWLLLLLLASPATAQPAPVAQEPMEAGEATTILGRQVMDAAGKPVARIIEVLVDQAAQPRAAVLEFGGFLGVGQRRVAVAWRALTFSPADRRITLELDAAAIAAMPEWKPGAGPVMLATPP